MFSLQQRATKWLVPHTHVRVLAATEADLTWAQEDKKSGGGFMGTVKSLLVGGGNGTEAQTSTATNTNVSASHSKGSQTATSGSSATQEYQSSTISSKEYHSTNTYAVDTKVRLLL